MIYGHDKIIHRTTALDVETYKGKVVSVWFRCMALPFQQYEAHKDRARDMENMSREINGEQEIQTVTIKRREKVGLYSLEKTRDCSSHWYISLMHSITTDANNRLLFNSKEDAERQRKLFGLDDTWRVVEHAYL